MIDIAPASGLKVLTLKFLLAALVGGSFASGAMAHSFNVTLLLPLSGPDAGQGRQFLNGFMLATRERDAHPNQESDGHLGGLDVYVTTIDNQSDPGELTRIINGDDQADIVALFPSPATAEILENSFDQSHAALLLAGQNPFSDSSLPGVAAFSAAYLADYSQQPDQNAASGYNMARRIDQAVRSRGGASDIDGLQAIFMASADNFNW